jgi:hypothetical protein
LIIGRVKLKNLIFDLNNGVNKGLIIIRFLLFLFLLGFYLLIEILILILIFIIIFDFSIDNIKVNKYPKNHKMFIGINFQMFGIFNSGVFLKNF